MSNYSVLFERAHREIEKSSYIVIGVHETPDGDAIGSMLALGEALRATDRDVVMYSHDPIPSFLSFLPGVEEIHHSISWFPDLIIGLDYGSVRRLKIPEEYWEGARVVTFDHHPEDGQRGDVRVINTSVSSTAELLYAFFRNRSITLTPSIATCLLTGIFTDTGGFVHVNATERTHRVIGELLVHGANITPLIRQPFAGRSLRTLQYFGRLLSRMHIDTTQGMAYLSVPYKELKEYGGSVSDLSGIVSLLNVSKESLFSLLLVEYSPGSIKGSLRTEPWTGVDVSGIAKILGGGGHTFAAGFELKGDMQSTEDYVQQQISSYFTKTKPA